MLNIEKHWIWVDLRVLFRIQTGRTVLILSFSFLSVQYNNLAYITNFFEPRVVSSDLIWKEVAITSHKTFIMVSFCLIHFLASSLDISTMCNLSVNLQTGNTFPRYQDSFQKVSMLQMPCKLYFWNLVNFSWIIILFIQLNYYYLNINLLLTFLRLFCRM